MRNLSTLDRFRYKSPKVKEVFGPFYGDKNNGGFLIASPIDNTNMIVTAVSSKTWEYVGVTRKKRRPNWVELALVKRLFFEDDEVVMSLFCGDPQIDPFCNSLELWRPKAKTVPMPTKEIIAMKNKIF